MDTLGSAAGTIEIEQREVDEFAAQILRRKSPLKHLPLSAEDQAINAGIQVRIAGHDARGYYAGMETVQRDAALIDVMHADQVVKPAAILEQMQRFRAALQKVSGDWMRLDTKDFAFMRLGGHIESPHIPSLLLDICQGTEMKTYALLLEHVSENNGREVRVPVGYNFGFTEMPMGDPRFQNLDARDIGGVAGAEAMADPASIWASWRLGIVETIDQRLIARYRELGIEVPKNLHGMRGRNRGWNHALKVPYVIASDELRKKYMMYNTASVALPHELAIGMPNAALRLSNEDMFGIQPQSTRHHVDRITDEQGHIAANVQWDLFAEHPSVISGRLLSEDGLLKVKGGFDIPNLIHVGDVLAETVRMRAQVRSLIVPSTSTVTEGVY